MFPTRKGLCSQRSGENQRSPGSPTTGVLRFLPVVTGTGDLQEEVCLPAHWATGAALGWRTVPRGRSPTGPMSPRSHSGRCCCSSGLAVLAHPTLLMGHRTRKKATAGEEPHVSCDGASPPTAQHPPSTPRGAELLAPPLSKQKGLACLPPAQRVWGRD